jgi:hypothetical protein
MSEEHALVLVAGYQDLEPARRDFDALAEQVRNKQVALRGAVLAVGRDQRSGNRGHGVSRNGSVSAVIRVAMSLLASPSLTVARRRAR